MDLDLQKHKAAIAKLQEKLVKGQELLAKARKTATAPVAPGASVATGAELEKMEQIYKEKLE